MDIYRGHDDAGMWCRDNAALCPHRVWWCDAGGYARSTAVGVLCWSALFCAICGLLYPLAKGSMERWPSKFKNENCAMWFGWHVQSTIHAFWVSSLAFAAIYTLSDASAEAQFDASSTRNSQHINDAVGSIANTSHVFFCYILVDTLITLYRKEMTVDYFLHHLVFGFFCVVIQYHCFAPYLAGWLLIMELSTIFLNGFSFFRNRLGYDHFLVKAFFLLFASSFLVCRILGMTYIAGSFILVVFRQDVPFAGIPRWHLYTLVVALVGAVVLQYFWAYSIGRKVTKVLVGGSDGSSREPGPGGPTGDDGVEGKKAS